MRPVGVTKKGKKGQKLSCVKLAICPDHQRRRRPLKICMRGRVREVVIYFKFHENRSRGLGTVGVENHPLPLTRPMLIAYNSLYYRTSRNTAVSKSGSRVYGGAAAVVGTRSIEPPIGI